MSRKGIKYQRYSTEERDQHFKNWQSSGVSSIAYCEAHNINLGTFDYWCRLHKKYGQLTRPSKKKEQTIQPVFKEILPVTPSSILPFELHYPNGVVLKLKEINVELVKQLLDA